MTEKKELNQTKNTRVIWDTAENLPSLYANHLSVSFASGTEFHIVFGHLSPPLVFGLSDDELPDTVKIKPIANIVVNPEVMKAFLAVLNDNFNKYENMIEKSE